MAGSVVLNQGLPDERFSTKWQGEMPRSPESVKQARRQAAAIPKPKHGRTDPVGVKEELERELVEADRQAEQLEASSAAREEWGWTPILQVGFGMLGIVLLGGVAAWKWKGR